MKYAECGSQRNRKVPGAMHIPTSFIMSLECENAPTIRRPRKPNTGANTSDKRNNFIRLENFIFIPLPNVKLRGSPASGRVPLE